MQRMRDLGWRMTERVHHLRWREQEAATEGERCWMERRRGSERFSMERMRSAWQRREGSSMERRRRGKGGEGDRRE